MQRPVLYLDLSDDLRWLVKRAALDSKTTVRGLVTNILIEWLTAQGYNVPPKTMDEKPMRDSVARVSGSA
jgi:hypothetical protein